MLKEKLRSVKKTGENMLADDRREYILLVFLCLFSAAFLIAAFLFVTTGNEVIFLHDVQLPFLSSGFQ
ncbi:MAG: hypothetical protein D3904_05945 [Candidatus Electrothrix sp. EH2]|nr:hypothetical protein [Candidatus Electrothrix sp. EH2]